MSTQPSLGIADQAQIGYSEPLASCEGEIELGPGNHFLLGRNGRGKTTLLRSIAGSIGFLAGGTKVAGNIFYLSEDLSIDRELNSKQAIKAIVPSSQRTAALDFAVELDLDLKKRFGELSTGNKRKLCILLGEFCAAADEAPVLLLDEPYTGLDDKVREALRGYWEASASRICRLIVAHPDQDNFSLPSALTISDQKIRQLELAGERTWSEVRKTLK